MNGTKIQKTIRNVKQVLFFHSCFNPFNAMLDLQDSQDRDVILISYLTMISATLPNYYERFGKCHDISPHLYLLIVGEPTTGKGAAMTVMKAIEALDEEKLEVYKIPRIAYVTP